ncbi:N-acetylmuramoyl-L-alanine amidase [Clostridium perfringens]|uniref:N-acetylmuramoyl-L-alanine amidase n=1 Tax=Clostridium perfringens TaxID=1502 RepID=UPI0010946E9C|nr:N-acetylmuramoyl-L-alanine amidase [Clostridium perfringens]MDG6877493.1 N-acetylmuramoyl-L-alanine amidase LytC precursor [Clostridium perfringens]TGY46721.1 N-acetylmuramoyl-L-alanine amidase [Clostridium perfringens]
MQVLYTNVAKVLREYGHTVIDCNSNAYGEINELSEGANKANDANVDIFISLHMNCFDSSAHGVEALTWGATSRANSVAQRLCNNYAKLGFYNRGVKYTPNDYEMKHINAPNIIFETCFCDSAKDIAIFSPTSWEDLARAIANAIDPNIPFKAANKVPDTEEKYQIKIFSFESKELAEKCSNIITKEHGWYNVVEKM